MVYKVAICDYILWQVRLEDIDRGLFQLSIFSLFGLESGLLPWAISFWTIEGSNDKMSSILSPEDIIGRRCFHDVRFMCGSYRIQDGNSWGSFMVLAGSVWDRRCLSVCFGRFV